MARRITAPKVGFSSLQNSFCNTLIINQLELTAHFLPLTPGAPLWARRDRVGISPGAAGRRDCGGQGPRGLSRAAERDDESAAAAGADAPSAGPDGGGDRDSVRDQRADGLSLSRGAGTRIAMPSPACSSIPHISQSWGHLLARCTHQNAKEEGALCMGVCCTTGAPQDVNCWCGRPGSPRAGAGQSGGRGHGVRARDPAAGRCASHGAWSGGAGGDRALRRGVDRRVG